VIDRRAPLSKADPAIYALIRREVERQEHGLELIASENFATMAVMEAMGSALTNKYAEGLPRKRYYGGCEVVDEVEQLAIDRAKALFKAEHVNVQPHSGAQANMAAYLAVAKPGAALLGLALSHGGHLTHGSPVNFSGTLFRASSYGVREETGRIDYDQVREIARRERPRILVGGAAPTPASSTSRRSAASPTKWARSSSSTWRISRGSWPPGSTPRPCRTRRSSPPPPTRRCAARAAG